MSNIPEDIKWQIFEKSESVSTIIKINGRSYIHKSIREDFIDTAEFGYSLALPKIEELKNLFVKALREINNDAIQIAEQAKEIERLKDIIGWYQDKMAYPNK